MIEDISYLSDMSLLERLDFSYNQATELPAFQTNYALVSIDGSHNNIASLAPLAGLKSLNVVLMDYNKDINDVNVLEHCYMLVRVSVFGTKVTDISKLTDNNVIVNFDPTI